MPAVGPPAYLPHNGRVTNRLAAVPADRLHLVLMLVLTFTTGIVDAVGFLGLDRVFTGNMTGNVVILGMAAEGAEVEEIVPRGSLGGDAIHLPGIYVHRIIQGDHEKRIEQRTVRTA